MDEEIKIDKDKIKEIFRNKNTLICSILSLITFILAAMSYLNITINTSLTNNLFFAFSKEMILFLGAMFLVSAILAYYKKTKLMFLPLIVWLLIYTASVRASNISNLKDVTTGDWTLGPDLDPFLYLRHAQEIETGTLEKIDYFRQAPLGVESYAYKNLMPWSIVGVHKIINLLGDYSLTYAAIISPVIFFLISLFGFLLFVKTLSSFRMSKEKSWIVAIIASFFYATVPTMLHRTVAGVPEIESLGMTFFWLTFLFFTLAWKNENKKKNIIFGVIAGIFTGLMSWTWGGYAYIYLTLSLTVFLIFLFEKEKRKNFIIFFSWMIPSLLFEFMKVENILSVLKNVSGSGLAFFVGIFMIVDLIIYKTKIATVIKLQKLKIPRPIKSLLILIIFVSVILLIIKPAVLVDSISLIIERLLYPFGRERIGLTVSENKAPYFIEAIENFGYFAWIIILGSLILFREAVKNFRQKYRWALNFCFFIFILGIALSRYSSSSVLNGDNFISKLLYLGGIVLFLGAVLFIYIKSYLNKDEKTLNDFKELEISYILMLVLVFWAMVSIRGAIRLFFIIAPILVLIPSWAFVKILDYKKESKNKDLSKLFINLIVIIVGILMLITFASYSAQSVYAAKSSVPSSYNQQWQKAMGWVRDSTPENSIFVHWWDYGYWIQTIGERPTVTDGGHANAWWDHTTARYLLTTPKPETAMSLMKTYNVSYLLIDSTDLGKYSAYSSIGSDESGQDRLSWIPIMINEPKYTQETQNSTIRVYGGGGNLDEDIIYKEDGKEIFLPKGKASVIGVIIEISSEEGMQSLAQPQGIFYYNGNQIRIPIRYIYFSGELLDFGKGVESTLRIIPGVQQSEQGMGIDNLGAIIYLSSKTKDSLFAQLYLMDDPSDNYPTIKLAYTQSDPLIENLKTQGAQIGEFIYYQGFRGPIKIWEVEYPKNILTHEEFLKTSGIYGGLDNLDFVK